MLSREDCEECKAGEECWRHPKNNPLELVSEYDMWVEFCRRHEGGGVILIKLAKGKMKGTQVAVNGWVDYQSNLMCEMIMYGMLEIAYQHIKNEAGTDFVDPDPRDEADDGKTEET